MGNTCYSDKTKIPIVQFALPMFIENVIRASLISVDQFMLYGYSEKAVAAVSVVNQMAFFIQLIYTMVALGASINISQNLGAGNRQEAKLLGIASILLTGIFSILLSLIIVFSASSILGLYPLEKEVNHYAWQFLVIYGGGSIFMALNIVQSNILRAYGHTRDPMIVNVIALVFTIVGDAFCLFGFFGFPILGVKGVACSTVISQFLAFWILGISIMIRKDTKLPLKNIFKVSKKEFLNILKVGVPTAGENLSYTFGQIIVSRMIAGMGTSALAAYSLVITLSRYVFIPGLSIGTGTQIKVGYYVGAKKEDEAQQKVYRYFITGFIISFFLIISLNIFKKNLIGLFTQNNEIVLIASSVLLVAIFMEPGRNFNTIIIPGLKGAGDVRFPVFIGMIFSWCIGVGGAYILGISLKLGLVGIWVAMGSDEWVRGLIMFFRWKSGAWRNKSLVELSRRTLF
jgi:putative MATE family efflux protein